MNDYGVPFAMTRDLVNEVDQNMRNVISQLVQSEIDGAIEEAMTSGQAVTLAEIPAESNLTIEHLKQAVETFYGLNSPWLSQIDSPRNERTLTTAFYSGWDVARPDSWTVRIVDIDETNDDKRLTRFNELRAEGKKLGEINTILEQEGFSEVSGEGVMPCPTKHHEIVRENKGVKRMIQKGLIS